jgi:hypothetical protein
VNGSTQATPVVTPPGISLLNPERPVVPITIGSIRFLSA